MEIGSTPGSSVPSVPAQPVVPQQQRQQEQQTAELEVARTTPEPDQRTGTVIDTQA